MNLVIINNNSYFERKVTLADAFQVVVKGTILVVTESVKIVAASIFLHLLNKNLLSQTYQASLKNSVFLTAVFAPIVEEILFRGILLKGIHLTQVLVNHYSGKQLADEDLKTQKVFRVHLSAIIFALSHLANTHRYPIEKLIQLTWTYIAGVSYGYAVEKYKTLSVSIFFHGVNNFFACASKVYSVSLCLKAILINKFVAYLFIWNEPQSNS